MSLEISLFNPIHFRLDRVGRDNVNTPGMWCAWQECRRPHGVNRRNREEYSILCALSTHLFVTQTDWPYRVFDTDGQAVAVVDTAIAALYPGVRFLASKKVLAARKVD